MACSGPITQRWLELRDGILGGEGPGSQMSATSRREGRFPGVGEADSRAHWQRVYRERDPSGVSWYEAVAETSLALIAEAGLAADAAIVDAGGGASPLTRDLLAMGYRDLTVADISAAALERSRAALGSLGDRVQWVQADLRDHDFGRTFDLWHDRAVSVSYTHLTLPTIYSV